VDTLSAAERPTAIFVSGPHTNLAEALRLAPEIREHILEIYVMGGSIYVPGNIASDWPEIANQAAEWNIWVDPVAAREVLAAELPLHVMPLDGTNQVLWNESDARAWASPGTPEGSLAADLLQMMQDSWSIKQVYIWDLAAAIAATDARLCPEVALGLDIEMEAGPEQGRTYVREGPANADVCLQPDPDQIRARATSILGK
jgi:pyrimidine-specific ribonucleoside hydrolase